jgi:acyl-[acyl-carrier-protein] desaturase
MLHFVVPPENELSKNIEVIQQIEPVVHKATETNLVDPRKCWQPTDFLPDMESEDALEKTAELRKRAAALPEGIITCLVGNMITEEALPSYQTYFNLVPGINEERSLVSEKGWVKWSRMWTAEENRHGDLLNKYIFLTGRADMKEVEITIHNLLSNGVDAKTDQDPYQAIIYTSFQERATRISHVNTGKLASRNGDEILSRICKTIAGDESRHEKAYKLFMSRIFEIDPDGALVAFQKMMKKQITMPAALMDDGNGDNLFFRFSAITQNLGIYTTFDYASIIEHLVELWNVGNLTGLKHQGAQAQDYLMSIGPRYRKIAERIKIPDAVSPPWISKQGKISAQL